MSSSSFSSRCMFLAYLKGKVLMTNRWAATKKQKRKFSILAVSTTKTMIVVPSIMILIILKILRLQGSGRILKKNQMVIPPLMQAGINSRATQAGSNQLHTPRVADASRTNVQIDIKTQLIKSHLMEYSEKVSNVSSQRVPGSVRFLAQYLFNHPTGSFFITFENDEIFLGATSYLNFSISNNY